MATVDFLLFCVVGCSVLVALILDIIEEFTKFNKCHDDEYKIITLKSSTYDHDDENQEEEEKQDQVMITQNIEQVKETEQYDQVHASAEEGTSGRTEWNMDICVDDEYEGDFDDWEGIERSDLEKVFGEGLVFMSHKSNAAKIDDEDLKLKLFGLQKVVFEGSCRGSQPMAFNVSARSKWDAWQKLGDMSRETAMEKYVDILSKAVPGWKSCEGTEEAIKDAATSED